MNLEPMLPRASLVTDAVTRLETYVRDGMQPGDRLPAESEIARQLGVSRPVVREALAFLRADGLVETRRGQGLFVSDQVVLRLRADEYAGTVESIVELLEFRRGLEGETVRMAAQRRSDQDIADLQNALDSIHEAEAAGRAGVEEDLAFHLTIARISKNALHFKVMQFLSATLRTAIGQMRADDEARAGYVDIRRERHTEIFTLIAAGDADAAHRAMTDHMSESIERYRQMIAPTA
jgi:GntR family transcriptional repressor for pyruvate dehydrogenase complex